jgi:hypothetical protein
MEIYLREYWKYPKQGERYAKEMETRGDRKYYE